MEFGIICPYCGYEHDGLDYIEPNDMEGEFVMDCEECERQLAVNFKTSINFKAEKSE
ncbi:hypothetical protein [Clostridium botulinum]|uniref:CPXCG motif-containing cysteine-rich protein n=1 Tax=Clostridium botulinum CFSAN001627 TaxID=1232189 RepID=M1ZUB1_CLOBO|nr:hypothetical protein [Clostridium botulinum]EKN42991.1 hypothetical protein CFSAN001627_03700 [Clostridium botulinum CFSAN001627]MBY6850370.1 hypothetical protein [Clostridium botulinum]MBY6857430.1 hypothetical protein [Clostridium botulinum]MBY6967400.1 hypothetical protein [Clostridium botulinum]HBJ1686150.1 hypothetical protein [Clostridium botulinum]